MDRPRLWPCKTLTASFIPAMISSFATHMGAGVFVHEVHERSSLTMVQNAEYY